MRALVLAGGGAKGAYQVGALGVFEEAGYKWDSIYGVSVGALNGAMLAEHGYTALKNVWLRIKESDIHHKYAMPKVLWRIATGKGGVYDNKPLLKTIIREVGTGTFNCRVGYVSLQTGEYYSAQATPETIFASATMPVVWEPTPDGMVDGGVRNMTPLAEAIADGADEIVVILCNPLTAPMIDKIPTKLIDVAKRSMELAMNEIAINDINSVLRINDLLRQAKDAGVTLRNDRGLPYRHVNIIVVEPSWAQGDTLDFSQKTIRERMADGEWDAIKVIR